MKIRERIVFFIPHFCLKKDIGDRTTKFQQLKDQKDIDRAVLWWKNDEYTKVKRWRVLVWLGKEWFRLPYKESIKGNYFIPADDLIQIIGEMQKDFIIPELSKDSKVFEPGCNVGRNLFWIRKKYDSEIFGMDISENAINIAKNEIWKDMGRQSFFVDNVLTSQYFDNLPDNFFDLVITRWHLIHLPYSPQKIKYVESLKRIAKVLLILEPVNSEYDVNLLCNNDRFCLSWDNWETFYGLKKYNPNKVKFKDGTSVFYYKK